VVASNDGTAGAPSRRSKSTSWLEKSSSSGQDADLAAIIRHPRQHSDHDRLQALGSQATLAAEAAVAWAKGEAVKNTAAMLIGRKRIPAIVLSPSS